MRSEKDKKEIAAWKKPKVGDKMKTPIGIMTVTYVDECRWSGNGIGFDGKPTGFGNIPFWESGNWRVFKVIESHTKWQRFINWVKKLIKYD